MSFLLNQAIRHLEQGLEDQRKGYLGQARYHYLKAAEYLFKSAKRSSGEEKRHRTEQAEALLERAQALERARAGREAARREVVTVAGVREDTPWLVVERPPVRFDDVAGLDDVKEQIRLRMVYPFTHPELARRYGIKRGGGLLLFGPPGVGKTLLARAVAGEIDAPFFSVKPSDIMSKWVGEAEQNIAKLFSAARRFPRAVIFIDEVEALIPKRRRSQSTVMQRVVPQILSEMEGFERHEGALLFIGATNEPWMLDQAVLRPGRFDEKIYVPLPDFPARRRILEINLRGKPLASDVDIGELAELTEGYSGADIVNVCRKVADAAFLEAVKVGVDRPITKADFLSALHEVRPSVDLKDLRRFEEFAKGG